MTYYVQKENKAREGVVIPLQKSTARGALDGRKMPLKIGDTIATEKFLSYLRQCGIMGLSGADIPQLVDK